ncbi:uncharacterized protein LOC106763579 [Vigna radiata var. radiata]|uniref:Uncharacterized protein LOC106763579 n=1 Tax=Vigna radiata var. radiata TaxID=3916 RepID=A0A1S3UB32_VIGRR|nr:uncharacterized protein LOC106763579 [Vigna radiata var. radiata]
MVNVLIQWRPKRKSITWAINFNSAKVSALNDRTTKLEEMFQQFMQVTTFTNKSTEVPIKNLMMQVPVYAIALKSFLEKKRYLDVEIIDEQDSCSVLLKKERPPKVKDPGSFTIPCVIGNVRICKALIDLWSSINLMPLSMLKKISGLKVNPTKISLLMADGSPKKPYGLAEDVVIQVEKLEFLVDFVMIEMEEDKEIPIILGRLFIKRLK